MDESIVGTNVGQRFQRGNTTASGYSRMMQGKSPEPNRKQKNLQDKKDLKAGIIRDPKTGKKRGSANNDPKKQTVKSTGTGAKSNVAGKGFQLLIFLQGLEDLVMELRSLVYRQR